MIKTKTKRIIKKNINEIKDIEERIEKARIMLDYFYNSNLKYSNKLKVSQYMDKLINNYYRSIKK